MLLLKDQAMFWEVYLIHIVGGKYTILRNTSRSMVWFDPQKKKSMVRKSMNSTIYSIKNNKINLIKSIENPNACKVCVRVNHWLKTMKTANWNVLERPLVMKCKFQLHQNSLQLYNLLHLHFINWYDMCNIDIVDMIADISPRSKTVYHANLKLIHKQILQHSMGYIKKLENSHKPIVINHYEIESTTHKLVSYKTWKISLELYLAKFRAKIWGEIRQYINMGFQ